MLTIKLIGTALVVGGVITFTQGSGWERYAFMIAGALFTICGILVLAPDRNLEGDEDPKQTTARLRRLTRAPRVRSSRATV